MPCVMYVDRHRHVIMEYKRGDKFVHTISMISGEFRTHKYTLGEFKQLGLLIHQDLTPEHFVEVCLKSTLPKTDRVLAVIGEIQGKTPEIDENAESNRVRSRSRNYTAVYTLRDIIKETSWIERKVRKQLRKRGNRPSGRWEWSQKEAEEVMEYLLSLDEKDLL